MATSPHHRSSALLGRLLLASVVWLATLSLLLVLAPRGAAASAPGRGSGTEASADATAEEDAEEAASAGAVAAPETGRGTWSWPLSPQPRVLRAFDPPRTRYGPGHRGIDLAAHRGQTVVAVAAGVVSHSGAVAGRGTVTVRHPTGVSSTYEPVEERVADGAAVTAGATLGTLGVSDHCAPTTCLHLGARLGEEYLDPLLLLARPRIVLLPLLDSPG